MELIEDLDALPRAAASGTAMCLGVFDGVHRGHQLLMRRAREEARARGLRSLVFTFAQHPLSVLAPPYVPPMLTSPEEKARQIEATGVDLCLMLDFTAQFAAQSPDQFLREILAETCQARFFVCGRDFRFGRQGAGDVDLLQREAPALGFDVEICDDVIVEHGPVKSTRVRQWLLDGDVGETTKLLGRPYSLLARVVRGDERGRQIGFPTANLQPPPRRLVPEDGVYAVWVEMPDGGRKPGMLNIGVRPTFEGERRTLEVHLLDYDGGELYDQRLNVLFMRRIRDEQKFDSPEALVRQLQTDRETTRAVLGV